MNINKKRCFVFGSNTGGYHGGGAAYAAYKKHGARWGMGFGHYGDSFAIPTKAGDKDKGVGKTLPLADINQFVQGFIAYAKSHPKLEFQVTRIGCGLAGLKDQDIAPMFKDAPINCLIDSAWSIYLPDHQVWGKF